MNTCDEPRNMPQEVQVCNIAIRDEDVIEAMKAIPGYLDITPMDFREIYRHACQYALARILTTVRAGDIMTPDVVSANPDMDVAEVARRMASRGVSGVPVVGEGRKVVGVISERDFLRLMGATDYPNFMWVVAKCLTEGGCLAMSIKGTKASQIMSSPPVVVSVDAPVAHIGRLLREKRINRVPVVNSEGQLVGIVSRADILRAPFFGG